MLKQVAFAVGLFAAGALCGDWYATRSAIHPTIARRLASVPQSRLTPTRSMAISDQRFPITASDGRKLTFRHVNGLWVENDSADSDCSPSQETYPEVCLLHGDDAEKADKWAKRHGFSENGVVSKVVVSPKRPESEAAFVEDFVAIMSILTTVSRDNLNAIARVEYARCTQAGYLTTLELNDCVTNHPDQTLVSLSYHAK